MFDTLRDDKRFVADIAVHAVGDLLQLLERTRRSGAVVIESPAGRGTIELRSGRAIGATAPEEHPFGKLVSESIDITAPDAARTLAARAAVVRIQHAIQQLIGWDEGVLTFHPASRTREIPALVSCDVQAILIDSALEERTPTPVDAGL